MIDNMSQVNRGLQWITSYSCLKFKNYNENYIVGKKKEEKDRSLHPMIPYPKFNFLIVTLSNLVFKWSPSCSTTSLFYPKNEQE